MRVRIIIGTITLGVALWSLAAAQGQDAIEKQPGYVNFEALGIGGGQEPTAEVNIKGSLLKLLGRSALNDDPELGPVIARLDAIRVETYDLDSLSAGGYEKVADRVTKYLEERGWETIVSARERGERTRVAVKTQGEKIVGLFILAVERDEASFINIVGEVNPEEIGKLGHDLNISPLDSIDLPTKKPFKKDKSH